MVGELIAGRYELEQRLGSGGMAEVFCASDRLLERRVAVKVLHERWSRDPDLVERFRREARTTARLSHPNIVTAIDRGEWRGRPYIVLEYIEGTNLKQLVLGERQVPIRDALELAVQIGRGLGYAHRHGVVHRDVKPQNVLLGVGEAKVTDFGVALSSDLDELTLTGSIVGTSDYLAPEQADGRAADERSDVYSLGVVVFELLTGAPPFSGDSFLDVALQHLSQPAPSVLERRPDTPPRIAAAVARALAKVPGSRFQSMDEFVAELEACRADGDPSDGATMIREPPRSDTIGHRPRNRRRLLVSAAVLALLAAAAVIGVPFLPSQSHPRALAAAATRLRTVAAYDPPPGDGVEDNQRLPLATDNNPVTYWDTEWYANQHFGNLKSGVGIVLDAGKPARLKRLTVQTDTPGFTAIVKAAASSTGPFQTISQQQTVQRRTTIALNQTAPAQYYLLWITSLAPGTGPNFQAHVNEVTVESGSPDAQAKRTGDQR